MQIQKNVNLTPEVKIFLQVNLDPYSVTASILKGSFFVVPSPKSNWDQIKLTMTHLNMEMKVSIQSLAAPSIIFKSIFVKLFFFKYKISRALPHRRNPEEMYLKTDQIQHNYVQNLHHTLEEKSVKLHYSYQ